MTDLTAILEELPAYPARLEAVRERLLANLTYIAEVPAPSFHENARIGVLEQRFQDSGLEQIATDPAGNLTALLSGTRSHRKILLSAHTDTVFPRDAEHTVMIQTDRVSGIGLAHDSLGLAVLATLPTALQTLGIRLQSDLVLLGETRCLGRGVLGGLRFFLDNRKIPVDFAIRVKGTDLGKLSFKARPFLTGGVTCRLGDNPERLNTDAITILNQVIMRLREAAAAVKNDTEVVLNRMEGGTTYGTNRARSASLQFQLRSASDAALTRCQHVIEHAVQALAEETQAEWLRVLTHAVLRGGGLADDHGLVEASAGVLRALSVDPDPGQFASGVAAFAERGVPAVEIGITHGRHINEPDESLEIQPMITGLAQLVGLLLAIDGDCCG